MFIDWQKHVSKSTQGLYHNALGIRWILSILILLSITIQATVMLCISCWWIIYPFLSFWDHYELYNTLKCSETQQSLKTLLPGTQISQATCWNAVAPMQGDMGMSGWEGNTRLKPKGTRAKHLLLTWPRGSNATWELGEQLTKHSNRQQKASFTHH